MYIRMEDFMHSSFDRYFDGVKKGLPIGLGYIPVSFTFGFIAVSGGLPAWIAVFISMSNLTSSGQFAGMNLILAGASYFEIAITTFIINIRYSLMSLSLSQKLVKKTSIPHRLLFSFGVTDEIFAVASMEKKQIDSTFMYGLITLPYIGWTLGTILGAFSTGILPDNLKGAMGIALYGMFIALIIPPSKHSRNVLVIVIISILITCIIKYLPLFSFISSGFRIIIASVIAAGIGTFIFPEEERTTNE